VRAYATNSAGTSYGNEVNFTTLCGGTLTIIHTAGDVAPVGKTVIYGTVLSNLSGSNKCWITQNLGADNKASSATDNSEAAAGWYWQFNRKQGFKYEGTTRTPNTTWITSIDEASDWTAANNPCLILLGTGWRIPTSTEWTNADVNGGWDDNNETYASVLKLHSAGYLGGSDGSLYLRGSWGVYYSSMQYSNTDGWHLIIGTVCEVSYSGKEYSRSLRCLRD
jgi:hypothetical protein